MFSVRPLTPNLGAQVSGIDMTRELDDATFGEIYRRIARRCAVKIAELQRDMTSKFPNIVVQNT